MNLKDLLYSKPKLDQFERDIAATAELSDPAARLLRYKELLEGGSAQFQSDTANNVLQGAIAVAALSIFAAVPVSFAAAGPALTLAMGLIYTSFAAISVVFGGLFVEGFFQGRADKLRAGLIQTKDAEEASASFEALAPSSKLDDVLVAYPNLKERFGAEAIRKVVGELPAATVAAAPAAPRA